MCGRRRPSDGARGRLAGRPSGILTGSTPMSACLPDPAPAGYTSTRVVSDFRLGGVRMGMDDHGAGGDDNDKKKANVICTSILFMEIGMRKYMFSVYQIPTSCFN